jgi:DNA polymerase III delta subunit
VALIARHLRLIQLVQDAMAEGYSGSKLADKTGISPYFLRDYSNQSKKWSAQKLRHTLCLLSKTDHLLKSSPLPSKYILEDFIIKTCL